MAAFSYHPYHLLDQSLFFPTTTTAASDATTTATAATACLPEFNQPHDHAFHVESNKVMSNVHSNNNVNIDQVPSSKKLQSPGSSISMVVDDQKVECDNLLLAKKRKDKNVSSINSAQSKEMSKRLKKHKKSNDCEEEGKKKKIEKGSEEEGQIGYIHVRARRGQATDSHSLAERVRREKISERMKLLQAIVPGCDKVTGKALMLDEIINYVQSLQNQVEFLSMKLASTNPMFYDFGVDLDAFMLKPDQNMSCMGVLPIMPSVQPLSTANDNFPQLQQLIDTSTASLLFQQAQMPNILSQGNGQLLWDVDDQKQKLDSSFALNINNLTSFH